MVNTNLTLVVELVLFVVFLWGVTKFILHPALHSIDEREEKIERENTVADAVNHEAQGIEADYGRAISGARADAEQVFREAHSRAVEAHAARMAEARRTVDERVLATREQGKALLAAQRAELMNAAPGLADDISGRLGIGGRRA